MGKVGKSQCGREEADAHIANGAEILGTQWVDADKNEHLKLDQEGSPEVVNPFVQIKKSEGYVPNYKSRLVARGGQEIAVLHFMVAIVLISHDGCLRRVGFSISRV